MSRRITLISSLEQSELNKINKLMSDIKFKTCKVPYGIDDEYRYDIDNLPYNFTIFATNKENQKEFIDLIKTVNIDKIVRNKGLTELQALEYTETHLINNELLRTNQFEEFIIDRTKRLLNSIEEHTGKCITDRSSEDVINYFG